MGSWILFLWYMNDDGSPYVPPDPVATWDAADRDRTWDIGQRLDQWDISSRESE